MKKILVIEDNTFIRENTAEILELAHYEVITAENGEAGVQMALNEKPDLIICDVLMPLLDGFNVLRFLKENDESSKTPFIFLSAKTEKTDINEGMELGADDYIKKPFSDFELLQAVERQLNEI